MANAAAKKAAAAKSSAASIYGPILLGTNVAYLICLLITQHRNAWMSFGADGILILCTWALQAYAYMGILEDASKNSSSNTQNLVGGAHLDLLAVTWIVQFGTVLWTRRFFWILAAIPPWGVWMLYQTVYGMVPKPSSNTHAAAQQQQQPRETDEITKEKRQRRAEKRRQKWS